MAFEQNRTFVIYIATAISNKTVLANTFAQLQIFTPVYGYFSTQSIPFEYSQASDSTEAETDSGEDEDFNSLAQALIRQDQSVSTEETQEAENNLYWAAFCMKQGENGNLQISWLAQVLESEPTVSLC